MKPFGVWHEGPTMSESDFFLEDSVDGDCCDHCINLYTADQLRQAKVEALREAAEKCWSKGNATEFLRSMADEIEKDGK